MPVVKVYGFPNFKIEMTKEGKDKKKVPVQGIPVSPIWRAVAGIDELELTERYVTVFFLSPSKFGSSDVIVEISGLYPNEKRTPEVKAKLAKAVGEVLQLELQKRLGRNENLPLVEVFVQEFHPFQGFWTSCPVAQSGADEIIAGHIERRIG